MGLVESHLAVAFVYANARRIVLDAAAVAGDVPGVDDPHVALLVGTVFEMEDAVMTPVAVTKADVVREVRYLLDGAVPVAQELRGDAAVAPVVAAILAMQTLYEEAGL